MTQIYGLTTKELEQFCVQNGFKSFCSKQIFGWLYCKYADTFAQMSNISKALQNMLELEFTLSNLELAKVERSKDGTKKYLFKTVDNFTFEAVFLKMKDAKFNDDGKKIAGEKYTFCISSQIGCRVGCTFCLTAKGGFVRNLSAAEIVEQVVFLKKDNDIDAKKSVNIVFMGMGEPLLNLENVSKAIKIMSDKNGLDIAPRRQTISTSGIAPKIHKLGTLDLGVQLAISLHAPEDDLRSKIMPINKRYNLKSLMDAVLSFPLESRKRVMFEYLLLDGVNDSITHAKGLLRLLNGIKVKVNLILFNPYPDSLYNRPSDANATKFADYLNGHGLLATIRESKGIDISAACGQLIEKQLDNNCSTWNIK
ncbi:MAG: 23S rRNA (adenine(2503)-C(2))-methyltransferase RlmN [Helicobacter sp.]|nr:23S rRNA (adenine(2503)-C(2))-methyltransferase RlmN [Helicobacter sp.]